MAALSALSVVGYKAYVTIQENAIQKSRIELLENEIKIKDLSIQLMKQSLEITKEVVQKRDADLEEIQKSLDELNDENLPVDKSDKAPPSTQIFLERLKGITSE